MRRDRVVIVGAGIGGLSAAVQLAAAGREVVVLEAQPRVGGKMREVPVGDRMVDGGPTVFTMRWVFEELMAAAGTSLDAELTLQRADILARHAWDDRGHLDLFADVDRSADAIGDFCGAAEAQRFRAFMAEAGFVYRLLEGPFLKSSKPGVLSIATRIGLHRSFDMLRMRPFSRLWPTLQGLLKDPRLIQLYGRYATYCGSSPFNCPATLMLVAHVEQDGVWMVEGGMYRLAEALARVAGRHGATIRCDTPVQEILTAGGRVSGVRLASGEVIEAETVIANTDANALAAGLLGAAVAGTVKPVPWYERSLSALAITMTGDTSGFPLARHTVFFSRDYRDEFEQICGMNELPHEPTVYICAQDRSDDRLTADGPERMLAIVNAPAVADVLPLPPEEIEACLTRTQAQWERCGLKVTVRDIVTTTPKEFAALFPATGGALYGRANHGWDASFRRPDATTKLPGLYLCGGSVHPGPGVPMASLSGQLAARSVLSAPPSTSRSRPAAMSGGMSMHSPTTDASASR